MIFKAIKIILPHTADPVITLTYCKTLIFGRFVAFFFFFFKVISAELYGQHESEFYIVMVNRVVTNISIIILNFLSKLFVVNRFLMFFLI